MTNPNDSAAISVCVCTFKRPKLLHQLLCKLREQETRSFSYSITVVDNDAAGSAEKIVQQLRSRCGVTLIYHLEPEQNIALARNKAIVASTGDLIAFIDDDELPG